MAEPKGTFLQRYRVVLVGGMLLLLAAHLIGSRVRQGTYWTAPESLIVEVLRPLQVTISRCTDGVGNFFHSYLLLVGVSRENRELRAQVDQFVAVHAQVAELQLENRRLAQMLELRDALQLKTVLADVIGSDATGLARTLVLNEGRHRGLLPGMAVITPAGVVGKLISASPNASRVMLLNDHNCAIDALDQRSRARGIVAGVTDDGVTMKYVERSEDIKVGDTLITSGLDGVFPRGLLLGAVSAVERQGPGLFINVTVKPAVHFRNLEQVMIVTQPPPRISSGASPG